MNETEVLKIVLLAASKAGSVLFRNNTGMGWVGQRLPGGNNGMIILQNARPLDAGLCKGSSDLIGWTSVEITPEMVGRKMAVFTAVEVKAKGGKLSDEQRHFLEVVDKAGGFCGVARGAADVQNIAKNIK